MVVLKISERIKLPQTYLSKRLPAGAKLADVRLYFIMHSLMLLHGGVLSEGLPTELTNDRLLILKFASYQL
jgi:hypothetical protein